MTTPAELSRRLAKIREAVSAEDKGCPFCTVISMILASPGEPPWKCSTCGRVPPVTVIEELPAEDAFGEIS